MTAILKQYRPSSAYECVRAHATLEGYEGRTLVIQKTDLKLHNVKFINGKYVVFAPEPIGSIGIGKPPTAILPAYIKPEIMGTAFSGLISLSTAICAFATGQLGIGIALLGPFIASILGCFFLIFLSRKVELKE